MSALPLVSIVIPARNSSKYLLDTLKSIEKLEYPKNLLEVIVSDNGSTDNSVGIARQWGARIVEAPGLKVGGVRNHGARNASGAILAFTDSDIVVGPSWISAALVYLKKNDIGAVGGACHSPAEGTWVEKAWPTRISSKCSEVKYLAGSSFILKRDLFEKLGGFNEGIVAAEDDDLSQRIRNRQLKLLHVHGCETIHLGYPKTLINVARRQIWHGSSIQFNSNKALDTMNILTYLFLFFFIFLIPGSLLLFISDWILIVNLLGLFTIPFIVAIKRALKGSEFYSKPLHCAQLWIILIYYFSGRSIGLMIRNFKGS